MKRICYGVFGITFSLASHAIVYTTSTQVGNYSTAGLEGFYIDYQKPSLSLDDQGGMGSVIGSVTHNYSNFFLGLDGRGSWGKWRYNSAADGTISGVPQAE